VAAIARSNGEESDIWTYEISGKTEIRRLTFGGTNRFPVWSADGKRITFQSARESDRAIFWQAADGAGSVERLTKSLDGEEQRAESWSPDGAHLLFSKVKGGKYSLWVLRLSDKKIEPFARVQSAEPLGANFSPDGRWVVYASSPVAGGVLSPNRGVFIERFPPTGELHQVPKKFLDFHPMWSLDGKGVLYIPGSARPTVFVPVVTRPTVEFGTPVDLQRGPSPGLLSSDVRGYDMLPDGRFLSLAPDAGYASSSPRNELRVVLNWFEELKRLAPVK
jgi:Tol biopolymer transport system component